ncbi:YqcC family protein [Corallincola platygyrae]|uniref:YqcC family protein n=1 Tax=Corallincola platygyrae TaxID=1193278 RepID=A0ABW4XQJ6_9GAMM
MELKVKIYLGEIAHQLRDANLWSSEAPSEAALQSSQPFCCDSMPFEQWLQFVFLPKMNHIIEQEQPLPVRCDIAPMAEHTLDNSNPHVQALVAKLRSLDSLLQGQGA